MTHADIYEKFMIEYDKENITTSYPSLTDYEIATLLDKAYLALIAQNFTGNNQRRMSFEGDVKAVEDLQPLIKVGSNAVTSKVDYKNELIVNLDNKYNNILYIVDVCIMYGDEHGTDVLCDKCKQIQIKDAYKFTRSSYNKPWSKTPMYFIYNKELHILKRDINDIKNVINNISYKYIQKPKKFTSDTNIQQSTVEFELSDTMAEELINLALIIATEIVESPRLQTKIQMKGLES